MLHVIIAPCQKAWQRQLAHRAVQAIRPILQEQPEGLRLVAAQVTGLLSEDRELKKLRVNVEASRYGATRVVVARPYTHAPDLDEVCLYLTENPSLK